MKCTHKNIKKMSDCRLFNRAKRERGQGSLACRGCNYAKAELNDPPKRGEALYTEYIDFDIIFTNCLAPMGACALKSVAKCKFCDQSLITRRNATTGEDEIVKFVNNAHR